MRAGAWPAYDCHNIHATEQKVLNKATQADVCFTCHKEQRAQTRRISTHPLVITGASTTAKMSCSDCHNPHGSTGPTLLIKNTVNETCYTCHAEKRGPFLWEHAPVTDSCVNCHTPHGSNTAPLLRTRPPYLCQECHSGDHGAQVNSGANLAGGAVTTVNGAQQAGAATPRIQVSARACLNCHVLVHGSNHPGRREIPAVTRLSQEHRHEREDESTDQPGFAMAALQCHVRRCASLRARCAATRGRADHRRLEAASRPERSRSASAT